MRAAWDRVDLLHSDELAIRARRNESVKLGAVHVVDPDRALRLAADQHSLARKNGAVGWAARARRMRLFDLDLLRLLDSSVRDEHADEVARLRRPRDRCDWSQTKGGSRG